MKKAPLLELTDDALAILAERFRVLSEPTRLKLLLALQYRERNVNDLVRRTGLAQANVSRQLKLLAQAGVVSRRQAGVCAYYRIADPGIFTLCGQVCGSLAAEFARRGLPVPAAARAGRQR